MLVSQISQMSGRAQNLLSKMVTIAPILQYAQFRLDASTAIHIADKDNFSGSAARAEGSPLQKDGQIPESSTVSLALYGREISIDDVRKLDASVTGSPNGLKLYADRRLGGLAVKLAKEIQDDMIKGTGTDNRMLGLANFVKDADAAGQTPALGFTAAEIADMNYRVGMKLDTEANQNAFVETLEKMIASIPSANALLVNVNLAARLTTIAKRIGAAGESVNSFGVPVKTFNGIPIVALPTSALPQDEDDGTNNDNCSMFIVRFAEELGTVFNTNSGFYFQDFQDYEATPSGVARLQFFLNLAVDRSDGLVRLSRIRL